MEMSFYRIKDWHNVAYEGKKVWESYTFETEKMAIDFAHNSENTNFTLYKVTMVFNGIIEEREEKICDLKTKYHAIKRNSLLEKIEEVKRYMVEHKYSLNNYQIRNYLYNIEDLEKEIAEIDSLR